MCELIGLLLMKRTCHSFKNNFKTFQSIEHLLICAESVFVISSRQPSQYTRAFSPRELGIGAINATTLNGTV